MKLEFRTLTADEIQVRVQELKKNQKGQAFGRFLLYKDARCDMNILDEVVGAMNWQKTYSRENANCIVSIWDEDKKQWINKEDTGTESNTEAEKGLASDSFKRACVNWGIGRELYTSPSIIINLLDDDYYEKNEKLYLKNTFKVSKIVYDEQKNITELKLQDKNGNERYTFKKYI